MSNIIVFDGKVVPDYDSIAMSNGKTDIFINILAYREAAYKDKSK